jgi:hypothetical protein
LAVVILNIVVPVILVGIIAAFITL